jgi:hypothetical protein
MTPDEGKPLLGAQVGEPVPGEETFDADHESRSRGRKRLETRLGCCPHMPVEPDLSMLVYNTAVQRPSVQVKATVEVVWRGGEAPEVSSSSDGCVPNASSPTAVCGGGGLNKYQSLAGDS